MKILQINASYKPAYLYGGPTRSVSKLSEQLITAGHEVHVFTTTANGLDELPVQLNQPQMVDGVPVTYFKRITKDHSHFSPALLRSVWTQAKKYDTVHIHAWWNLVSVLSCLIAVLRGVPVVVSPRGTLSEYSFHNKNAFYKKWIHALLTRPLLKRCTVHVTSAHEQNRLMNIIEPKSYVVIPNFIELPAQQEEADILRGEILKLIFFSRIEEKKGMEMLILALKEITIPYHLTIAGDGRQAYIDELKHMAEDNGVSAHISWIGFQSDNKFEVLRTHDLFVLPSYDENFGNAVIESLSVGTAVLVSEHVGLAGYIQENKLGRVCTTEPASIATFINTTDKAQLTDIRKRAPAIITSDFNEINLVQKYISMYRNIISHG